MLKENECNRLDVCQQRLSYIQSLFLLILLFIIWIPLAIDKVFMIDFMTCFLQCALSSMYVRLKGLTCHIFFALVKWFYKNLYNILCRCFKFEVKVIYASMGYNAIIK